MRQLPRSTLLQAPAIGAKVPVHGGVEVGVSANVIEVLSVDEMAERFTVVFTLRFEWVDPLLKDFKGEVAYWYPAQANPIGKRGHHPDKADLLVWRRRAKVLKVLGPDLRPNADTTPVELGVDPQEDFAVGDVVEADVEISHKTKKARGPVIPRGTRGVVASVDSEKCTVEVLWTWRSRSAPASDEQLMSNAAWSQVTMVAPPGEVNPETQTFHVTVPYSNFIGKVEPDWASDRLLFKPQWSFENQVGDLIELVHQRMLTRVSEQGGHVSEKYKFQATFSQKLKLQRFPFDRHDLSINLTAERRYDQQQWSALSEDAGKLGKLPTEWGTAGLPRLAVFPLRDWQTGAALQRVRVNMYLKRNPRFFLKHLVVVTFVLGLSSVPVILVKPRNVEERAAILLSVLLVMAAYKHMTSQWVPRKPYYTWMDYYILLGFLLQLSVLFESLIWVWLNCLSIKDFDQKLDGFYNNTADPPPDYECSDIAGAHDRMILLAIYGTWVGFHVFALIISVCAYSTSLCQSCCQGRRCSCCLRARPMMNE